MSDKLQLCVNEFNCFEQQKKHCGLFLGKAYCQKLVEMLPYSYIAILSDTVCLKDVWQRCWSSLPKPFTNELGYARLVPLTTPLPAGSAAYPFLCNGAHTLPFQQ